MYAFSGYLKKTWAAKHLNKWTFGRLEFFSTGFSNAIILSKFLKATHPSLQIMYKTPRISLSRTYFYWEKWDCIKVLNLIIKVFQTSYYGIKADIASDVDKVCYCIGHHNFDMKVLSCTEVNCYLHAICYYLCE